MSTVKDIYDYIDSIMPFDTAESWDNSGLLVGDGNQDVSRIITCLDITNRVVDEAIQKKAELIISHHPIIFNPIKKILSDSPVYKLIRNNISAICVHTPADISEYGTNAVIYRMLSERIPLSNRIVFDEESGIGWICECNEISAEKLADILNDMLGCCRMKYVCGNRMIKRIAFCSGSGGSMLKLAAIQGCDAYITGDIKHDVFVSADDMGISLYDCGHYETEIPFAEETAKLLTAEFPYIITTPSEKGINYIK